MFLTTMGETPENEPRQASLKFISPSQSFEIDIIDAKILSAHGKVQRLALKLDFEHLH